MTTRPKKKPAKRKAPAPVETVLVMRTCRADIGIVGEDGLKPNTKYRAAAGKWVVVP